MTEKVKKSKIPDVVTYKYNLLNSFANMYHVSNKYKIVTLLKKVSVNI